MAERFARAFLAALLGVLVGRCCGAGEGEGAAWQMLRVPGRWRDVDGRLAAHDGFAWYRAFVFLPPSWGDGPVSLQVGTVDDCDETFVNGRRVGGTGSFPPEVRTAWTALALICHARCR